MNIFSRIRIPKLGKNNFDLSFENKLTCQMGQLVPIVCQEVIPGDQFKMSSNILCRFNPLLAPMMHRVDVYTHYFFVPNRLVWDEWEDFITGGEDGLALPEKPYTTWRDIIKTYSRFGPSGEFIKYNKVGPGSLLDFLGYSLGLSQPQLSSLKQNIDDASYDWLDEKLDILPLRAYSLIYNEYYRNQNTQSEIPIDKNSGYFGDENDWEQLVSITPIRYRNWGLDYFTSALPFSQRGPEQLVPVKGEGSVNYTPTGHSDIVRVRDGSNPGSSPLWTSGDPLSASQTASPDNDGTNGLYGLSTSESGSLGLSIDNSKKLSVDYNDAQISIRDLRRAERLQEFLERSARAGSRYIEQIKGHFGVFSSDKRLQRPEYLGGGKQVVQISAVDQTSATDLDAGTTPLGSMAGKAISGGTTNGFKTSEMEEHGWIIGIMSVLPKGGYHQGLNRKLTRFDKLDYFWPEFQNIGDQEIKSKELYFAQTSNSENGEVGFGYTPRYAEYKCNHDEVHGEFKTTLDFWHLNRKFASMPKLNSNFSSTENNIRQDIFAVMTDADGNKVPNMMIDIYNNIKARRPMYYYENPDL